MMTPMTESLPTWDLTDLYAGVDDPAIAADLAAMIDDAGAFAGTYKGTLAAASANPPHLLTAILMYETLLARIYKVSSFSSLLFSLDAKDQKRGALMQKVREASSDVQSKLLFFDLELGTLPDEVYSAAIASDALADYHHYLEQQRSHARHFLSEPEEKILVETANSRGRAFVRLFDEIGARTTYTLEYGGESEEVPQSEILSKLYEPDRELRKAAAAGVSKALAQNAHAGTYIYNTLLHEKDVIDRLRGYPAPEASRHLANELDAAVIETVTSVCVANFDMVADYYRIKGKLLDIPDLTHYDRYAPIGDTNEEIPYSAGKDIVLEAFAGFSPRLAELVEPFFQNGWIDAPVAEGKRSGAFCAGVTPDHHPYVLLNYTNKARDVMTLAHELGHGVHDVLASRNTLLNYHPVLPMAETASTFAEMLVYQTLSKRLDSREDRIALMCDKLEDSFATIFRQISMYRFEQDAHRERREHGEVPIERFNELWQANQQAMFGDALTLGDEHAAWWLYIPHIIHTPFYVYAYAFGELLVMSLYARYEEEGDAFIEHYFELLAVGGSKTPAQMLSEMGIDVADRAFWQGGCDVVRARLSELQGIV
jgi:oligoendopeptidase F